MLIFRPLDMKVANMFITMFESMDDDYFREKSADIKDVVSSLIIGCPVNVT